MTRPKKEETLAKTKDVHLRMNETEYDLLAERAKANSMTVSEFYPKCLGQPESHHQIRNYRRCSRNEKTY